MNFDLSDDQKMLAEQARKMLEELSTPDRLRELIDTNATYDQALWQSLAELGFLGAAIPEEFGGVGMSAMELAMIAEEVGRFNAAIPFSSTIVQAAKAIELAGSQEQKETWLPKLAAGETIACFSVAEGPSQLSFKRVTSQFSNGTLSGRKSAVVDGSYAEIAVVACLNEGMPAFALVDLTQETVTREELNSFDELRPSANLTFNNTPAELLTAGDAETILNDVYDYSATLLAFEQVGGTEACLYMARDYAMDRQIFGRQLSSYQAIKHKLASIFIKLELARSNAMYAAWALTNKTADCRQAISVSRVSALDAFETAAQENLQVHGGIGYTFEANCHFYYRRERLLASLIGGKDVWSDKLIDSMHQA